MKLDPVTLKPDTQIKTLEDHALFYSKIDDPDIRAVVEFVLIVKEIV